MASKPTYLLICDMCGDIYTPTVQFANDMKIPSEATCARMVSHVRSEATASGWSSSFNEPEYGIGWTTDLCRDCTRIDAKVA